MYFIFPYNVQLFPHHTVLSVYQVKTGKSSLEQISRVYGNQVFLYSFLQHYNFVFYWFAAKYKLKGCIWFFTLLASFHDI
jgi:hypothetical protein